MRVICENCGASYTVPDSKLTKAMNKATCKACSHVMMIPKPGTETNPPADAGEWEDEEQTRITDSPLIRPPSPVRAKTPATSEAPSAQYDPSGDLAWAALGSFVALLGAFLLGLLSLPLGEFREWLPDAVLWTGLAFAFGGSVLTLSILSTGRRGRREANNILSVVAAFCIGIFMSSTLTTAKWGGVYVAENYEFSFDQNVVGASSTPIEAEAIEDEAVEEDQADAGEEEQADEEPETDEEPESLDKVDDSDPVSTAPPSAPVTTTTRRTTAPAPAPRASAPEPIQEEEELLMEEDPIIIPPRPVPAPDPAPTRNRRSRPEPAPAPNPTVPLETIDVILKNTNGVKACFVPLIKSGNIPPRIDVKFTLSGNGRASSISVAQSDYRGTAFEQCMQNSIRAINFPASGGSGQNINFPFVLQ